ncbi:MAG: tRNA ((46)-N7)-methyltransferase TrmB [Bacteroidota bacterium]
MSRKRKLEHFAEMKTFPHVVEADFSNVLHTNHPLKGLWNSQFFHNPNPIILELGCGKGEYTVGQAQHRPEINFIGIDIKGARMWRGAKTTEELGLKNVGFLRAKIDMIRSFFQPGEVQEIWITFPDPQIRKVTKRMLGTRFLGYYQQFLAHNGIVHLKTDSQFLYEYTLAMVAHNSLQLIAADPDIYNHSALENPVLNIRTHYEAMWLKQGYPSRHIAFHLPSDQQLTEPEFEFDGPLR